MAQTSSRPDAGTLQARPSVGWARAARRKIHWDTVALKVITHVVLLVLSAFAIAPLGWAISSAFKTQTEILSTVDVLPQNPTLANFQFVISQTAFPHWFLNSLIVSGSTTVLAIIVGSLAGYAMSRWRFRGRALFGNTLLVVQMFPGVMLAIPLYLLLSNYHLIDTLWALLVTYLTFALAFSVWMLKGFFDGIPREIEEAAMIDGASRLGILWRIILPLTGPGITTVAVYAFLMAWNEFFFAYVFLASNDKYTLMLGMYSFIQQFTTQWGNIMAAGTLTTLPVLVLFFLIQRVLTRGLITGAVKG
jgi:ABC-type glycerol-3-phosphate transport system permease component